ncbi:hypothetical protein [Viridibacillus arvi]|uniref:hypothetical protein n=1 Tax=Viridibacillus arvi TaxID=263475 RepID=UPI0034CDAE12
MVLEELFNHFQYFSFKRLSGVGIFDKSLSSDVKCYYNNRESLFTDGEVISNDTLIGEMVVRNPSYCISAKNYDPKVCTDPRLIRFEVFISNDDKETIEKAQNKLRELSKKVYFREKKFARSK